MEFLISLWPYMMVAMGLGFVIFIHELGHFAVAKWAGVKVEKFSIGFGPTLLGFQRGETYYSLSIIPLGGFVKMLGENPGEEGQESTSDPRSYQNKPVSARMAIISAGVIMNIITGIGFFAYAYRTGLPYIPAVVGFVVSGTPAYEAGIRSGDEIVAVDGQSDVTFEDFFRAVSMSSHGQSIRLDLKRRSSGEPYNVLLTPALSEDGLKPEAGIGFPQSIILGRSDVHRLPGVAPDAVSPTGLKAGDRIAAIATENGDWVDVGSYQDLRLELARHRSVPVRFKMVSGKGDSTASGEFTFPPVKAMDLGLQFESGPITSIQSHSPANEAGLKTGETIEKFNGQPVNPRTLALVAFDNAGKPVTLTVKSVSGEKRELTVTPIAEPPPVGPMSLDENQDIPALGLSVFISPKIASVEPGSEAEKAGIKAGQVIKRMTLFAQSAKDSASKSSAEPEKETYIILPEATSPKPASSETPVAVIAPLLRNLDQSPISKVLLDIEGLESLVSLEPKPAPEQFSIERGVALTRLEKPLPPQGFGASLKRGFHDTKQSITEVFGTIKALATQRVSRKLLGGPVTIATAAYASASDGLGTFMKFLGILSINLAVMNFLPIPPLDGGQMCFLIGEKVKGSPLPERVQVAFTMIGLSAVLSLMLMVLYQDILRVFGLM